MLNGETYVGAQRSSFLTFPGVTANSNKCLSTISPGSSKEEEKNKECKTG